MFGVRKLRRRKPDWFYARTGDIWVLVLRPYKGFLLPPVAFFVTEQDEVKFFSRPIVNSDPEEISFDSPEILSAQRIYPTPR